MSELQLSIEISQIVYGGTPAASLEYDGCETQTLNIDAVPPASLVVETQAPLLVAAAEQGPPGAQGIQGPMGPQGPQGVSGLEAGYAVDGGNF